MKLLITGACGFTGSTLARAFQELDPTIEICGVDNLGRPGSEQNRLRLHVGHDSAARPYDVPWIVLDSTKAKRQWDWQPTLPVGQILEEIAQHAEEHPEWLEISSST
jgi:nucleoside-diphosphate-sugar epimerase